MYPIPFYRTYTIYGSLGARKLIFNLKNKDCNNYIEKHSHDLRFNEIIHIKESGRTRQ